MDYDVPYKIRFQAVSLSKDLHDTILAKRFAH